MTKKKKIREFLLGWGATTPQSRWKLCCFRKNPKPVHRSRQRNFGSGRYSQAGLEI